MFKSLRGVFLSEEISEASITENNPCLRFSIFFWNIAKGWTITLAPERNTSVMSNHISYQLDKRNKVLTLFSATICWPGWRWGRRHPWGAGGGHKVASLYISRNISATRERRNAKLCTHLPDYLAEVVCNFDADPTSDDVTETSEVRL